MKRVIDWVKSLAWDRIVLLSSAAAILIYIDWRIAFAVTFVAWAIIRGINEVMKNVGRVLKTQEMGLHVLTKEVLSVKDRTRKLEGGGDYVH